MAKKKEHKSYDRDEESYPIRMLTMLDHGHYGPQRAGPHRMNHAWAQTLIAAIESGMRFEPEDFGKIYCYFNGREWMGRGNGRGERFYWHAVGFRNVSACRSFENWRGRQPFIVDGVTSYSCGLWTGHDFRRRDRATVGCVFEWQGKHVTVASFAEDGESMAAVHREWNGKRYAIAHRFKITHAGLRKAHRVRKEMQ